KCLSRRRKEIVREQHRPQPVTGLGPLLDQPAAMTAECSQLAHLHRWHPHARQHPCREQRARVSASRGSVLTRDLAISATCIGFATVTDATSGTSMSYRCQALLVTSSVTTSVRRRCLRIQTSKSANSIRRAVKTTCCLPSTAATVA